MKRFFRVSTNTLSQRESEFPLNKTFSRYEALGVFVVGSRRKDPDKVGTIINNKHVDIDSCNGWSTS